MSRPNDCPTTLHVHSACHAWIDLTACWRDRSGLRQGGDAPTIRVLHEDLSIDCDSRTHQLWQVPYTLRPPISPPPHTAPAVPPPRPHPLPSH